MRNHKTQKGTRIEISNHYLQWTGFAACGSGMYDLPDILSDMNCDIIAACRHCVSILTLQTAMFAAFGNGEEGLIRQMNGMTGAVVCLMVLGLGIQGICCAGKKGNAEKGGNRHGSYTCGGR